MFDLTYKVRFMKIIILEGLTRVGLNNRSELGGHLRPHHLYVQLMNYIDPGVLHGEQNILIHAQRIYP